jgi:hypothetical protein
MGYYRLESIGIQAQRVGGLDDAVVGIVTETSKKSGERVVPLQ